MATDCYFSSLHLDFGYKHKTHTNEMKNNEFMYFVHETVLVRTYDKDISGRVSCRRMFTLM